MGLILSPQQIVEGRYRVLEHFRDGGISQLYRVENVRLPGSRFLLKVNLSYDELVDSNHPSTTRSLELARSDPIKRALNEARITAKLNEKDQPNIIKVNDLVPIDENHIGIVYEGVANADTLEGVVKANKRQKVYDPRWRRETAQQILRHTLLDELEHAVEFITMCGFIHKDLKPDNILISGRYLKVIDFGIACPYDKPNELFGNRLYAPPEFFVGQQHASSDYWSLALIGLELLYGSHLFGEKDKAKTEEFALKQLRKLEDPVYASLVVDPEMREKVEQLSGLSIPDELISDVRYMNYESPKEKELARLVGYLKFLHVNPSSRWLNNLWVQEFRTWSIQ